MTFKIQLSLLLLFIVSIGFAQTIETDRPTQSDASSLVHLRSIQIETGFLSSKFEFSDPDVTNNLYQTPVVGIRYGLSKIVELRMLTSYQLDRWSDGYRSDNNFGLLEFGAKIQLLNKENVNTQLAFVSHINIPLEGNHWGTINRIAGSNKISSFMVIGYNVGYRYFGVDRGDLFYSVVVGVPIGSKFGLFVEPYGDVVDMTDNISSLDFGVAYLLKENLQLDCIYGIGLNHKMNYYSIGISWNYLSNRISTNE